MALESGFSRDVSLRLNMTELLGAQPAGLFENLVIVSNLQPVAEVPHAQHAHPGAHTAARRLPAHHAAARNAPTSRHTRAPAHCSGAHPDSCVDRSGGLANLSGGL